MAGTAQQETDWQQQERPTYPHSDSVEIKTIGGNSRGTFVIVRGVQAGLMNFSVSLLKSAFLRPI